MDAINLKEREIYVIKRKRKKIRLKELAEYVGCSVALLSKYENGATNLNPEKLQLYKRYIDQN